jgi:lipoprotein-anchoring transpeptidase ErfK/SrfK
MKALNTLSAIYLLSASAFGIAIALQRNPDLADAANRAGQATWPVIQHGAAIANQNAVQPALRKLVEADKAFFDAIDPPRMAVAKVKTAPKIARKISHPVAVAHEVHKTIAPPPMRPAIAETQSPQIAKVETLTKPAPVIALPQQVAKVEAAKPAMTLAPEQAPAKSAAASAPRPDLTAPTGAELSRVMLRLKDSLTGEMLQNFELFLYVSKADHGPWAQRMYVFRKQAGGDLNLLYNWPVSTGREMVEFAPNGQRAPSFTPKGYYELDPGRMYKHHTSGQWGTPMPYAMFFNWEKNGLQTGLAIHSATGDDVALLGQRASAGCVRLAPENAALLFNLIRTNYKGLAPRFAFDRNTASMSNDGLLMHDAQGQVKFAEGYKVLVFIENYGGDNVVAAVF